MQTNPQSSMAAENSPGPVADPPIMPKWFYFSKNGLMVAGVIACFMSFASLILGMNEKQSSISYIGGVLLFLGRVSFMAAISYATFYEHRVGLLAIAIISLIQYPIAIFVLQYFVWDHLADVSFVLVAVFAFWFRNRINKFCELNPNTPPGPQFRKKKVVGADGHIREEHVTQTTFGYMGDGVIVPVQSKVQIGRKW